MWLIHRRRRYTVSGSSMAPLLKPGQELLADPHSRTSVGDIVVSLHPHRNDVVLVKVLVGFDADGRALLEGLQPDESTDSRTFGGVSTQRLMGRVSSLLSREP